MSPLQVSILKTLTYADIFDYPLTLKEIHRWLINPSASQFNLNHLQKILFSLPQIKKSGPYYHFKNRHLLKIRPQRNKNSLTKLKIAQKITCLLKKIFTIKAILATGALAIKNAKSKDDIDLLIITRKNSLWLTRPFVLLILEILKVRRKPKSKGVVNKICPNVFLDESSLALPQKDHNLFTAHELLQAQPLFYQADIYLEFIKKNSWSRCFLPNAYQFAINHSTTQPINHSYSTPLLKLFLDLFLIPFNLIFYLAQLLYMLPRRTKEKISYRFAFFHPHSQKDHVLNEYQKRIINLGLKYKS